MSNVTLTIGGRHYTVACAAGEEAHIEKLGGAIDAKLQGTPGLSGQSEARTLLFAALLLADELHEARGGAALRRPLRRRPPWPRASKRWRAGSRRWRHGSTAPPSAFPFAHQSL